MIGYPLDSLYEEVAFIAYHLHWSYNEIMAMEHPERHRWASEVAGINDRLTESTRNSGEPWR